MDEDSTMRTLCPELCEIALENCKENAKTRLNSVELFETWIKQSKHLKVRMNRNFLLSFLRRTQFSLEEAKRRLDDYYSLKNIFPEVLKERTLNESMLALYRSGIHIIPKEPATSKGPRIILSQFAKCDPKQFKPQDAFKLLFMLLEILANDDDYASVGGLILVIECRDVSMEQMVQYDPFLLKKTWMLVDRCLPLRFESVHFINMRKEGQAVFNFVTSFLPAKMPIKFIVHKKAEDLYMHVPRDAMPIEYGGHNGYQAEALQLWEQRLQSYSKYFAEDDNYGTNEKLRIGMGTNWETGELTGVNGSFRKLEVD